MEAGAIVTGVISALIAIVLTLSGILKVFMPRWQKKNGINQNDENFNPGNPLNTLVEIRQNLQQVNQSLSKVNQSLSNHAQMASRDHTDTVTILKRIEEKLNK